jgi:NAD(P)-dependent dehydrogenase (short-subunit alcohol dehydrogenase family)
MGAGSPIRAHLARAFDVVAEATVAPSFSRVGIEVRRRLEEWGPPPTMEGRAVVVTGSTSGIGLATASALVGLGATVHLVGRNPERAEQARLAVESAGPGPVLVDIVDMADPEAVQAFAVRVSERHGQLAALVHNAGALTRAYTQTENGTELTVATHVLGPYVLTAGLAPLLWRSPGSVIVTVTSGGMYTQRFDIDHLEMGPDDYDGVTAYARAKRAEVVLAQAWATRFASRSVASYATHPGWVDTPGLRAGLPRFRTLWGPLLRTPAEGADTIVWLAAGGPMAEAERLGVPAPMEGLFHDRRLRSDDRFPVRHAIGPGDPDALMAWCEAHTGIPTPTPG